MKRTLFYSPNEAKSVGEPTPTSSSTAKDDTSKTLGFIPTKEADLHKVAVDVNASWKANTWATLLHKKQTDFETDVNNLGTLLGKTKKAKGNIGSSKNSLDLLDTQINDALSETGLKADIKKKFKKNALAQYGRYGLEKVGSSYSLPRDREKRLIALKLIPQALVEDGLGNVEFGTAFWNKIITDYSAALNIQSNTVQTRSGNVGEKDALIASIHQVLKSIIFLIRANYIDNAEAVIRKWGFRKTGQ